MTGYTLSKITKAHIDEDFSHVAAMHRFLPALMQEHRMHCINRIQQILIASRRQSLWSRIEDERAGLDKYANDRTICRVIHICAH